ncbi:MAG TPA: Gfo/Idh/MocA family oxidoreductase [Thermoanaerobaculia bacterium]|nr:Gfo/Idh/MocA family oxidoreductase [Thermoanaerobaculia bacterium]
MRSAAGEHRCLVVGCGSIGTRHLANLHSLAAGPIAICDVEPNRLAACREMASAAFDDFQRALAELEPELVLVCTPPTTHLPVVRKALEADCHVFVEKPISHDLEGVEEIIELAKRRRRVVQVGYNLRFHPGIRKLRSLLGAGEIGGALWAYAEFGQYLPDWRPAEDYRQSYTATRKEGGGILLDASHEIDYVTWLLGPPRELVCFADRIGGLDIDVEDSATLLLRFPEGVRADIHLDMLQRSYSRSCKIVGTEGTLAWDYSAATVTLTRSDSEPRVYESSSDPAEMYRLELEHFLASIAADAPQSPSLDDAKSVLEIVIAAKESAGSGRVVHLG